MKLSASQAAKETGKSIPTITRAIEKGRLSATPKDPTDKSKGWEIDPAELFRVFPPKKTETDVTPSTLGPETPNFDNALQVEIKMLREMMAQQEATLEDVKKDRDEWRRQATALLTDQRSKPQGAGGLGWFRRLFANDAEAPRPARDPGERSQG